MLDEILRGNRDNTAYNHLVVGNQTSDDAAAYQLDQDNVILSTTDFFMPIVDDPFTFGRIAACNAISDIYAMGGRPIMALAILGWPIDTLPAAVAAEVLKGGRQTCQEAGIPLAGGHSIDSPEPIFGLAVNGLVSTSHLKTNGQASDNCQLYLTKPLGIGLLTTAQKRKKIEGDDLQPAIDAMCTLNKLGAHISHLPAVEAVTDITGFGLLGHLVEMCQASQVSAVIDLRKIPLLGRAAYYESLGTIPGGTHKNYDTFKAALGSLSSRAKHLLLDPQTSGGLLIAVNAAQSDAFEKAVGERGLTLYQIGHTAPPHNQTVQVIGQD